MEKWVLFTRNGTEISHLNHCPKSSHVEFFVYLLLSLCALRVKIIFRLKLFKLRLILYLLCFLALIQLSIQHESSLESKVAFCRMLSDLPVTNFICFVSTRMLSGHCQHFSPIKNMLCMVRTSWYVAMTLSLLKSVIHLI